MQSQLIYLKMHREKDRIETTMCFETELYLLYNASYHRLSLCEVKFFRPSWPLAAALYLPGQMLPQQLLHHSEPYEVVLIPCSAIISSFFKILETTTKTITSLGSFCFH